MTTRQYVAAVETQTVWIDLVGPLVVRVPTHKHACATG